LSKAWNLWKGGGGVRRKSVWKRLLGLHRAVIEDVPLDENGR
jgi:hypothetical protein